MELQISVSPRARAGIDVSDLFNKLDSGLGYLRYEEINVMARTFDPALTGQQLEGLFRHFDPRASGIVDFEGFKRGLGFMATASDQKAIVDQAVIARIAQAAQSLYARGCSVQDAFAIFDYNRNGYLDQTEFYRFLVACDCRVTQHESDLIFAEVSKNSGRLDINGFAQAFAISPGPAARVIPRQQQVDQRRQFQAAQICSWLEPALLSQNLTLAGRDRLNRTDFDRLSRCAHLAMENQEYVPDLPESPVQHEVTSSGSNFLLYNLFDTISQASSEISWRFRSSRSVDALQAAVPEEQLRMWSQRYRCPPRAASLENLPRLRTMKPEDKELAFVMQAGASCKKDTMQDLRWLILLGFVLAFTAIYCAMVFQQAELDVIQQLLHNGMLIASSAGCLAGIILSTLFILMTRCFPNFMVRLLLLGSPIVMIVSGSVYTTFHCMTAGSVFLAVGITLLMVLFFGCQQSGLTGRTMGQVLHDLVCLHLLLHFAWLVSCSLVVLAADIRFKDMAVEILLAHIVVALIYFWGAEVLGYVAQVAYCSLLLRTYLGEDTRAFRKSFRTAFVVGSACYAATVGTPGCLWSILRQAEARRRGKCRED
eukprot:s304_g39.t2